METGRNMENKVISREYVEENYVHKDVIRQKIKIYEESINDDNYWKLTDGQFFSAQANINCLKELLEE